MIMKPIFYIEARTFDRYFIIFFTYGLDIQRRTVTYELRLSLGKEPIICYLLRLGLGKYNF